MLGWILFITTLAVDIVLFRRKREEIEDLKDIIEKKEKMIVSYRESNEHFQRELNSIVGYIKSTPSDCKIGEWCGGCKLRRAINIHKHRYGYSEEVYICGKDGICKNFVSVNEEK